MLYYIYTKYDMSINNDTAGISGRFTCRRWTLTPDFKPSENRGFNECCKPHDIAGQSENAWL